MRNKRHSPDGNRYGDSSAFRRNMLLLFAILIASFAFTTLFAKEATRAMFLQPFKSNPDIRTANPDASREARDVLRLLYEIKGEHTLSGQHNYLEEPAEHTRLVRDLTGHYPAVVGFELGVILNHSEKDADRYRNRVVREAMRVNRAGSLVTITYHASMPGACDCWDEVRNGGIPEETFREILTEGTRLHEEWLKDIDQVAVYLKKLRDSRVPVLWRPYHEMNGYWFWWGGQPEFEKLWKLMFDRYTYHHGLDNLLWVWSPSAPNEEYADPFEPYFVGHAFVDVLAVDVYYNDYDQAHHDNLLKLAEGKPIALGEVGELPDARLLEGKQDQYVWFMAWGDELQENNSRRKIRALYEMDRVLHRHDLSSMR